MMNYRRYLPSIGRIYTSLRLRSKEFLRENTLHGFPYFVDYRRPTWERICWFLCTVISVAAALGSIVTILQVFRNDPTLTGLDTDTDELKTHFPSFTLCQMNQHLNLNLGTHEPDAAHFRGMYQWAFSKLPDPPKVDLVDETYSELFYRAVPECGELYKNCVYGGKPRECSELFEKRKTSRGICCFVEATPINKESKPWELSFDTDAYPIGLDMLEMGSVTPERRSIRTYTLVAGTMMKFSLQITYCTDSLQTLPRKQRKCLYPHEASSYDTCLQDCQKKKFLQHCGCLPWFLSTEGLDKECQRKEYDCLAGNKTELMTSNCNCYLSCDHSSYFFQNIELREDNRVEIILPNWPPLVYRREVRFGWLDLLVSFGGIAGLFVGYSLLTTVEFAYYFSLRAYCGAVLTEPDKTVKVKLDKKSIKANRRKSIKVIDLKGDYYDYVN